MVDETDGRGDVTPRNLNELDDVDGEASDGDTLTREGGAWLPTRGDNALLPEFGPAITYYGLDISGSPTWANANAIYEAFGSATMGIESGYEDWPGVQPVLGEWLNSTDEGVDTGFQRWLATEPGVYRVYYHIGMDIDDAPHASGWASMRPAMDQIGNVTWGADTLIMKPVYLPTATDSFVRLTNELTLFISQGMIDAGRGGFDCKTPEYETSGAERAKRIYLTAVVQRVSPGSEFDYYAEL